MILEKFYDQKNLLKKMKFYQLRYYNTINCINLSKILISKIQNKKILLSRQKKIGVYYSAMPTELKTYCIKKFETYSKKNESN